MDRVRTGSGSDWILLFYAAVFDGSLYWHAWFPTVRTVGFKYGVRFADYGRKREC